MTAWRLETTAEFDRAARKLDPAALRRMKKYLDEVLELESPRDRGRSLTADLSGYWRYRVGDYRVIVELHFIYLLAEHHGSGIGQALLDALESPQVLWVAADNPRAQAFYRRNRFVADGRTQTEEFFDEPIDEIRMVRTKP